MSRICFRQIRSISNLGQFIVYFSGLWPEDYRGGQSPNYYWLNCLYLCQETCILEDILEKARLNNGDK